MILDYKRLNKQRVEAMQLLNAINYIKTDNIYMVDKNGRRRRRGWLSHPATIMWFNYENALKLYHDTMVKEWISRGYKNTMKLFDVPLKNIVMPKWLDNKDIFASHRSNLLRKDKEYYSQFGWKEPDNMEYVWPK